MYCELKNAVFLVQVPHVYANELCLHDLGCNLDYQKQTLYNLLTIRHDSGRNLFVTLERERCTVFLFPIVFSAFGITVFEQIQNVINGTSDVKCVSFWHKPPHKLVNHPVHTKKS